MEPIVEVRDVDLQIVAEILHTLYPGKSFCLSIEVWHHSHGPSHSIYTCSIVSDGNVAVASFDSARELSRFASWLFKGSSLVDYAAQVLGGYMT